MANRTNKANNLYYAKKGDTKGEVGREVKLRLYNALELPSITYASEVWMLQMRHDGNLKAADIKYLRRIEGSTKWDRQRSGSESIRRLMNQDSVISKLEKRHLG